MDSRERMHRDEKERKASNTDRAQGLKVGSTQNLKINKGGGGGISPWKWKVFWSTVMVNVLSSSSSMPITAPWANREKERERGGKKRRQSDSRTRHTLLSISILMPSTCSCSPPDSVCICCKMNLRTLLLHLHPLLLYLFLTNAPFSDARTHTHIYTSAAFWNMVERKGGEDKEEEVGFGRGEAGKGGERNRHQGPAASSQLQRNGLLLASQGISSQHHKQGV